MKVNEIELVNTINVIENSSEVATIYNQNEITKSDLQKIVVFKRTTKYITYLNLFFKRIIDIIGSLVGIILLIPITVVVATVNYFSKDSGPIFYLHKRIGKNGQHFYMYKFNNKQFFKNRSGNNTVIRNWNAVFQRNRIVMQTAWTKAC